MVGVEDDPVAYDSKFAGADDSGRQQGELEHLPVDDQSVPGVVPPLESHDHVRSHREPVDDLAFPLVAPLGADNDDIGHPESLSLVLKRKKPGVSDSELEQGIVASGVNDRSVLVKARAL